MPVGDMYQAWANATPTTPFPFSYVDKKVGKIQQSWADVRSGIQKDAVSTALPFCTGHITPSIMQTNIISDSIKKENTYQKRWQDREEESTRRSHSSLLNGTNSSMGDNSDTQHSSIVRGHLRSALEQDALLHTDGGRGRVTYLKMRRSMSPQVRYQGRIRTSAQMYGWNVDTPPDDQASQYRALSSQSGSGAASPVASSSSMVAMAKAAAAKEEAAKNLAKALVIERERLVEPLGQGIATGLRITGSRPTSNDFRRKNTLNQGLHATGVFPK